MRIPDSVDKLIGGQSVQDLFDSILLHGADCAIVVYEVDGVTYSTNTEMLLSKVVFLLEAAKFCALEDD